MIGAVLKQKRRFWFPWSNVTSARELSLSKLMTLAVNPASDLGFEEVKFNTQETEEIVIKQGFTRILFRLAVLSIACGVSLAANPADRTPQRAVSAASPLIHPVDTNAPPSHVTIYSNLGWVTGTQNAKLTASDGATDALLGSTLDISGNTIVAGAYNATVHSHASQGAAYVFVKPAGGWANATQTAKLTAADGKANDSFSSGISINANTIFLGSPAAKIGSNSQQGAVYQFVKPASGWKTTSRYTKKFTASDGVAGAEFGFCVAASRNTFVAGAILQTVGSTAQGTAYVFGPR